MPSTFLLPAGWRTRFAPAPTGLLHLGHAVNAVYVWGIARGLDGRVLLRIEDHDRTRCRPAYEQALLDDLDWLGLIPDVGDTDSFRRGGHSQRQSNSGSRYESSLDQLSTRGLVYACDCSRREMAEVAGDTFGEETRYSGRCRARAADAQSCAARRIILGDDIIRFDDLRLGLQVQQPSRQCGDLLARDRNGHWTYQFAVTVDDLVQDIDVVIRGEDLLPSTGRQVLLSRMLGRESSPRYLHHPLIRKPDGSKLSKSAGDTGLAELRAAGWSPDKVLGEAARLAGLPASGSVTANELGDLLLSTLES